MREGSRCDPRLAVQFEIVAVIYENIAVKFIGSLGVLFSARVARGHKWQLVLGLVAPRWGGLVRRPAAGAGAARQQWALQAGPAVEALALGEHDCRRSDRDLEVTGLDC
jgi:hypothetical protein